MRLWIIRHPDYGVFTGYNWNRQGQWAPQFKMALNHSRAVVFNSKQAAKERCNEVDKYKPGCTVAELQS